MSYENATNNSSVMVDAILWIMAVLFILILGVMLFPVIIFALIGISLTRILKLKEWIVPIVGFIVIVLTGFFYKLFTFIKFIFDNAIDIFVSLLGQNELSYMQIYARYNFFDYMYFLGFGLLLASIVLLAIYFYEQKIEAGIQGFEESVDEVLVSRTNNKKEMNKIKNLTQNINSKIHPEGEVLLGIDIITKKTVTISDRSSHIFIPGTTGAGKTTTIDNFLENAFQKGFGVLCIDGKGDVQKDSCIKDHVLSYSQKYNRKTYIINLVELHKSDKYNPFADSDIQSVKDMLMSMTTWSEEHYKINTQRYLQRVLQLMIKANIELSFETIVKNLNRHNFELLSADLSKKDIIDKVEHLENMDLAKASSEIISGAYARFADMAESEAGQVFCNDGIDIYTALKENAAIVFVLHPLVYPDFTSAFGRLVTIDAKKAVGKLFAEGHKRKLFVFDELNVYASAAMVDLINKSRSAGVTAILGTQSLADLEVTGGAAFKEQIIENCNNFIIMRQNNSNSAEELANLIGTEKAMEVTHQLGGNYGTAATRTGTAKKINQYKFHPDRIKSLAQGQALFLSKDTMTEHPVQIRKPIIPPVQEQIKENKINFLNSGVNNFKK